MMLAACLLLALASRASAASTGEAKYSGTGKWNLRNDLAHPVSFTHKATAQGTDFALSVRYLPDDSWSIGLIGERQEWAAGPGTDTTNFAGGSSTTQLNKVRWNSFSGTLALSLRH